MSFDCTEAVNDPKYLGNRHQTRTSCSQGLTRMIYYEIVQDIDGDQTKVDLNRYFIFNAGNS